MLILVIPTWLERFLLLGTIKIIFLIRYHDFGCAEPKFDWNTQNYYRPTTILVVPIKQLEQFLLFSLIKTIFFYNWLCYWFWLCRNKVWVEQSKLFLNQNNFDLSQPNVGTIFLLFSSIKIIFLIRYPDFGCTEPKFNQFKIFRQPKKIFWFKIQTKCLVGKTKPFLEYKQKFKKKKNKVYKKMPGKANRGGRKRRRVILVLRRCSKCISLWMLRRS